MDIGIRILLLCFVHCMIIEQGIDGDAFTQLPSDRTQLREEFQLTFGGAIKIVKLLSEVQTNKPGMYVYVCMFVVCCLDTQI